jgi:hypothetical protein
MSIGLPYGFAMDVPVGRRAAWVRVCEFWYYSDGRQIAPLSRRKQGFESPRERQRNQ